MGTASAANQWPDFQARLRAGPSNSPVKAKTPTLQMVPAATGTPSELARFGGAWEGWMCRNRSADLKIAVTGVTSEGAQVGYAYGSERFGNFGRTLAARFDGKVLRGRFPNGAEIVFGMRDDGHMNVKFERKDRNVRCFGILRRARSPAKATQGSPEARQGEKTERKAVSAFQWPNFQAGLKPGASNSPVKAKRLTLPLMPAAAGTPADLAAYGGGWDGWMCRTRSADLKLAVTRVTGEAAEVEFSLGSKRLGSFDFKLSARFEADVLRARFPTGAELILGMRDDGHMNVKLEFSGGSGWCTGILRRAQVSGRTAQGPSASDRREKGAEETSAVYRWPLFQDGLRPGPSRSPIKAKPPTLPLIPAAKGTPAHLVSYGGVWEGWMCRKKSVDLKLAITEVTSEGAEVEYSYGSKRFGNVNHRLSTRFDDDVLRGRLPNGAELILGMRNDGHMNVKWERSERNAWCTGILARAGTFQLAGQGPTLVMRYGDGLPMTVYFPERGSGPFPVVVYNHGRSFRHHGTTPAAKFALSRHFPLVSRLTREGIAVALPVRSGYSPGAGEDGERIRCNNPAGWEFRYAISWARADIADAVAKLKTLPNIDVERVFVGGTSAGGFASGGSMSTLEGKVKGIFVLNGGRCGRRGVLFNGYEYAVEIFSKAASKSSIPIVFYASEHDTVIPPPSTRGLYEATCKARGSRCIDSVFFVDVFGADHGQWKTTEIASNSILSFIMRGTP